MKDIIIFISALLFISNVTGQGTYFNNAYNYNDFSPASAIIEYEKDFIFSGVTYDSVNNSLSFYITSIDSIGNLNYWNTISDPDKLYWAGYRGCGLSRVSQEGFVASGCVNHPNRTNAILYRFNALGDTMWTKQYPDTINNMWTQFWDCNTTNDQGFIMVGNHSIEAYYTNIFLVKTDSLGNEQWRKEYGEPGWIKHGYSVVQTPDKGYLLGCYEYIAGQDTTGDPVVMKVDSIGNVEWMKNIGWPFRDIVPHVCLGNDGSYIAGTSISDSVIQDNFYTRIKVTKMSLNGDIIWERTYCQTEKDNGLYAIYPDHDGGYIATGKRDNYFHPGSWWNEYGWLLKIDENADSIWYREYQFHTGTGDDFNKLYDLCLAPDGGYVMVGKTDTWDSPDFAWVIKVDSFGCDTPGCNSVGIIEPKMPFKNEALVIYPNPATLEIHIDIRSFDFVQEMYSKPEIRYSIFIYDMFGRKQDEVQMPEGQNGVRLDVSDYPVGIYIVALKSDQGIWGRSKFVKR